ncbi:MAG: hypothetical protein PVH12_05665 [Candidatus Bathyarchaeota archaeon]|jgi:hypothetical protein
MTGPTIDHLVSVTVFLGAILVFIGLFNQTLQTAVIYQQHKHLGTKCSDLLDNILLNPGCPVKWGRSNGTPTVFGLQDPEFTQYRLSPFSLMRLQSFSGEPVYYPKTDSYYSNLTMGFGSSLLVSMTQAINYSTAARLLGINGTYNFHLTITPIIKVSISEAQSNPLKLTVDVTGAGFPLSKAAISYCFITVARSKGAYPSYTTDYGITYADDKGSALLNFSDIDGTSESYLLIAYAHLSGLMGVGYHQNVVHDENYVVPFISDFEEREVLIAHSYDVHGGDHPAEISYNSTFVLLTEDYTLREMPLENTTGKLGKINYGEGKPYQKITIPTYNPGILVITYRKSAVETGVVMMPWGMSSLGFPVTFGENPSGQEWVATDIRQVLVNKVAYRVQLALWSLGGYGVII